MEHRSRPEKIEEDTDNKETHKEESRSMITEKTECSASICAITEVERTDDKIIVKKRRNCPLCDTIEKKDSYRDKRDKKEVMADCLTSFQ